MKHRRMSEVRFLDEITADCMNSRKSQEGEQLHSSCEDPLTQRRKRTNYFPAPVLLVRNDQMSMTGVGNWTPESEAVHVRMLRKD